MKSDIQRHILTLTLGGALAVLASPRLHAQTTSAAPGPTDAASDAVANQRADVAADRQKVEGLHDQVAADKAQLKSDMNKYGKNSPQVKADKAAIKSTHNQEKALSRDVRSDRIQTRAARTGGAQMPHVARMGGRR